ncbi:hypothetical protein ABZ949_10725 [Micromonospora tulbaghiae]|uniref:hypothetical protein n=1 Tax=Micromonospora tulbaghiae TaxID=479978 RepID=UPI0013BDB147|nr:hypothetical protein [Micromonospora aurantiaca]
MCTQSRCSGVSGKPGYPRIGDNRELKRAVEAYWAGRIDAGELAATAAALRAEVWRALRDARLDAIPSGYPEVEASLQHLVAAAAELRGR